MGESVLDMVPLYHCDVWSERRGFCYYVDDLLVVITGRFLGKDRGEVTRAAVWSSLPKRMCSCQRAWLLTRAKTTDELGEKKKQRLRNGRISWPWTQRVRGEVTEKRWTRQEGKGDESAWETRRNKNEREAMLWGRGEGEGGEKVRGVRLRSSVE